jgi:prepilin-type N-terminal cleavage/methylation domain-containing protein
LRKRGFSIFELVIVVALLSLLVSIMVPRWLRERRNRSEADAIEALKKLATSEAIFRESDSEQDGNLDYGMLSELGDTKLIDKVLATGTKNGYLFQATYSFSTSEFLWFAVANPQQPGKSGRRSFATNMAGVIFYADNKTLVLDTDSCLLPAQGVTPVGR